jgi:hypothetical protein
MRIIVRELYVMASGRRRVARWHWSGREGSRGPRGGVIEEWAR